MAGTSTAQVVAHQMSKFDSLYRGVIMNKFFTNGWGNPDNIKRIFELRKIISDRSQCVDLVSPHHPIHVDKLVEKTATYSLYEGHFRSPMVDHAPELVPAEAQTARFQLLLPTKWNNDRIKPLCVHLAGTGDHYYWRRRTWMAKPLLKEAGVASLILENPFYGLRKPPTQKRSSLQNVSDIFVMGGCLILESVALFNWAERMGYGPLCITGISMGGHNASLAGVSWPKPISIVPCLSWSTASCAFTQGVMSESVPWDLLKSQYTSYGASRIAELRRMIVSPEMTAAATMANRSRDGLMFTAGQQFVRSFPVSLDEILNFQLFEKLGLNLWNSSSDDKSPAADKAEEKSKAASQVSKEDEELQRDVYDFMRGLMDECTHLANFSRPSDSELAIIVTAMHDGYIPRSGLTPLTELWPGSQARYLDCGHVAAILLKSNTFRQAIVDSLDLAARKYYNTTLISEPKPQVTEEGSNSTQGESRFDLRSLFTSTSPAKVSPVTTNTLRTEQQSAESSNQPSRQI